MFFMCLEQDKLSFALETVEVQTEEATCFQRQTNEKILLIKVCTNVLENINTVSKKDLCQSFNEWEFPAPTFSGVPPPDP